MPFYPPGVLFALLFTLCRRAALSKFGNNLMSNIDAMKYKSRFFEKPKGIQGSFVVRTKVRPFTVQGQFKNLRIE